MNQQKQQYLQTIRNGTAYPTYRGFIGTIAMIGYLLAGLTGLGAVIGGVGMMSQSFAMGLLVVVAGGLVAFLYYLLAKFFREAALILADLADSTVEVNSRGVGVAAGY